MKNQALFSLKDKSKKLKCCLLLFLFGALGVKEPNCSILDSNSIYLWCPRALDKRGYRGLSKDNISYFSMKTHVVTPH